MLFTADAQLEPRSYLLPDGLEIAAYGVTLDGNGACPPLGEHKLVRNIFVGNGQDTDYKAG